MKARSATLPFALLVLAVLGFFGVTRDAKADPTCIHVQGAFHFTLFEFTGPTTATGNLIVTGDLAGTAHADYFNLMPEGNGVFHLNGTHTIVVGDPVDGNTLTTYDESRLQFDEKDPAVGRANSRLRIIGGTGIYAGATGVLHTHGVVNFATLNTRLQLFRTFPRGRIYELFRVSVESVLPPRMISRHQAMPTENGMMRCLPHGQRMRSI